MAHNKTTNLPGSNDKQPGSDNNRNYNARDTSGQTPNMEKSRSNRDKTKQEPEEDHTGKTKAELQEERGGHGHSGHSKSRSGSDSGN
ncbi:hypothetical protein [Larkinella punicea]|uniref:Uncharacterized protein n=1 Tax=Larkinella punicea TaxID=2315727 RepID=A0A368JRE2_9BACT|nr:hypothetical protein [Larkinella punicea]RCR69895.1 hypothetical protein DUE52_08625 [Larkinella punicea]